MFPSSALCELDSALALVGNARADAMVVFPEGATIVHRGQNCLVRRRAETAIDVRVE